MSEILIDKLEKLLNEEKWTRATISNYTINNFKEFDQLIDDFKENSLYKSIKEITEEYLRHNKNSIVALYISSIINLEENNLEESTVYSLIKIFSDNLKWNIVEYLCLKVLDFIEDKYALNTLITTYSNQNNKDKLPELWERLIKVDYEEADIVVSLANLKEENNEIEESIALYKKAINRYILIKNFVQVEELWKKLITYEDISVEYFLNLDTKISKNFSIERSIELLKLLYESYKNKADYSICISILKLILEKSPTDEFARSEIVDAYRNQYKDHSQLEEYIKISNLEGSWRNIHDAISSFEKHIVFDKNSFVSHRSWGIGRITDISKDLITIKFQNKGDHTMSLKMALSSLTILPKNHISILKLKNIELLKKKIKEDLPWALEILITSFGSQANLKSFKEELVPDVVDESKWNSWWNSARRILKTDPRFDTEDSISNTFIIRDKPQSFEEKTYNSFKNSKDFNQRFKIVIDYLENADPDPDYLEEMVTYFASFLNSLYNVNENTIISYLLVNNIIKKYTFLKHTINYNFSDFFDEIEDPINIYQNLITTEFKKEYLYQIKKNHEEWIEIFVRIFYIYPNKFIYDELYNNDFAIIEKVLKDIVSRYKEYSDAFFWIVTNVLNSRLTEKLGIDYNNILFSVIHLIDILTKNININKEVGKSKKVLKQLKAYLIKDDLLLNYIDKSDKDFSKRLYTIINELISLDSEYVIKIKNKISDKFPEIDTDKVLKYDTAVTKNTMVDKLLVTAKSYSRLQSEVDQLKSVDIPQNSKEIGWAMEKGDLRENAEYKAAKEQQAYLQNKLNKFINDISKAIIIKPEEVKGDAITFGTKIKINDIMNNKEIEYTILGPFESDTEKNIISYQSPLGMNLLDKKRDEEIKFILNEKEYHYLIKNIQVADF